ncbi:MAG: class I SAM-dependent methyltransferase, partial [Proteobacteria bacterium]
MIESEFARSGQPILKLNGRYLASSFDPIKEANGWAARAAIDVGQKGAAIIIGAGCGYHVAALVEKCPNTQVLALEISPEIAAKALTWNPLLRKNHVLVESDAIALTESPQLRDAMAGTYAILPHLPTTEANPEWAMSAARFLLGRDKLSFLLQLRM